jgi:hypothetical protein
MLLSNHNTLVLILRCFFHLPLLTSISVWAALDTKPGTERTQLVV